MFNESDKDRQSMAGESMGGAAEGHKPEWRILEKVALASVVEQRKARRWGIFFKSLTFLYLLFFLVMLAPKGDRSLTGPGKQHVALVSLDGVIAADMAANANAVVTGLRNAFEAESAVGVILSINSPGGSPVQSGLINDEIFRLRDLHPEKKIYAVIADLGASGGYYIASAANEIYADKASLVGSIGVISAGFGFNGLLDKAGIDRRVYAAGDNKSFLDAFSPEKPRDREFWQGVLTVTHKQFMEVVKKGRGTRLLDDPEIFSGLVWTGEQAVEKGLVDGLGSVGKVARDVLGVETIRDYTITPNPFEEFAKRFGASIKSQLVSAMLPTLQ